MIVLKIYTLLCVVFVECRNIHTFNSKRTVYLTFFLIIKQNKNCRIESSYINSLQTNVGPILLSINPYQDVGNPLTLSSTRSLSLAPQLRRIVQEAVRQQAETGYPQAIILSGTSGAGKTHCSMLLLRQLFSVAGGGQ